MLIRLVFAFDDWDVFEVLEPLLQQESDFQIVARSQRGEETLHAVRQHRPDVLILTLRLPSMDGLEVLRVMRQEQLPTRVVLLTAALPDEVLLEAMCLGVEGVVRTEQAVPQLVGCIRNVYAGDRWLDRDTVGGAVDTLLRREVTARAPARGQGPHALPDSDQGRAEVWPPSTGCCRGGR
jgi:DNA-binding NarL/FixJ family response regulator